MRRLPLLLILLLAWPCQGQSTDPVAETAMRLIAEATRVQPGGRHHALLKALRHARDPELIPLYDALIASQADSLQMHGLMGKAEVFAGTAGGGLPLRAVANVQGAAQQAELLAAAMDDDLLDLDEAAGVLNWKDADAGLRMVVATRLVADGRDTADIRRVLGESLNADHAGRRALAALLLAQLGEPGGRAALDEIAADDDAELLPVKVMLLTTAGEHDLTAAGPFATRIITTTQNPDLRLLALPASLRFGDDAAAVKQWHAMFANSEDTARRLRLALIGLQVSPDRDAADYAPIIADPNPLIRQIGTTSAAIAGDTPDKQTALLDLIETQYALTAAWIIRYAEDLETPQARQLTLLSVVVAVEEAMKRGEPTVPEAAADATRVLFEDDVTTAMNLVLPTLQDPDAPRELKRAILLGIVRARFTGPPAAAAIGQLPDFNDARAQGLAVLLRARQGAAMSPSQVADLALLVRGGGGLDPSLRVQAAWGYLKQTRQAKQAVTELARQVP